ncbi:DoxX family protein [Aeromicrobium sp. Root495]|uniref:DoxX family protein n=1 Tax=Aeromicrobium sp. Root495 TaxID=1736550 RepID=UPI0019104BE1|nr:DoxX family protein [Aeromicrobium sp. Root495]
MAVALLTAAVFTKAGLDMVLARPPMPEAAARLGVPLPRFRAVGALELAGVLGVVVGLWWTPLGVLAAGCLATLTVGAAVTHVRAGDEPKDVGPAVVCCALAAATATLLALR